MNGMECVGIRRVENELKKNGNIEIEARRRVEGAYYLLIVALKMGEEEEEERAKWQTVRTHIELNR